MLYANYARLTLMKTILPLLILFTAFCAQPAFALSDPEEVVAKARTTAESMFSDPNYPVLLDLTTRAKAILIIPSLFRASFVIGGRGGTAVLLSRDGSGAWSNPAFYTMGGMTYGLQIGAQSSEIIVVVMTDKGLNAVMNRKVTLGADANVSLGQLGTGAQAETGMDLKADMYTFARSDGLYFGLALDGTWIQPRRDYNEYFYGKGVTPEQILVQRTASDPRAQPLVDVLPK